LEDQRKRDVTGEKQARGDLEKFPAFVEYAEAVNEKERADREAKPAAEGMREAEDKLNTLRTNVQMPKKSQRLRGS
jgi:hypothetical protein